jgi:hypothetical protein
MMNYSTIYDYHQYIVDKQYYMDWILQQLRLGDSIIIASTRSCFPLNKTSK